MNPTEEETRMFSHVPEDALSPSESLTPNSVQGVFPWLQWSNERSLEGHTSLSRFIMDEQPRQQNGWLFMRDGLADFALNASWDARATCSHRWSSRISS